MDSTVRLWDVLTRQQSRQFGHALELDPRGLTLRTPLTGITCLAFSGDGKMLAAALIDPHKQQVHTIHLWDVASGQELRWLSEPGKSPNAVNALAFSRDGTILASVYQEDNRIHLWDVATGKESQPLCGHQAEVLSLAVSPDGKLLASGSLDGTALIWTLHGRSWR